MRTVYRIMNTACEVIAEHVRVDLPTGKRMFWQLPGGDPRDGLGGLGTADLPLYNSQLIPFWDAGETVVVCEGERATETVFGYGVPALGTITGASGTPGEDALSVLLPFDVVTWEDHDEPGHQHMQRVAAQIIRLGGRARRLVWGREKGDDAADFAERGGTRMTLDLLIHGADPWVLEQQAAPKLARPSYDRSEGDWRVQTARAKLTDVVQDRLGPPKRTMGRSLFWSCPFHGGDREPSFKVDLKEPFFRCFGCNARGDVFEFLGRIDGAGFRDVLRELAPERLLGAAIPW